MKIIFLSLLISSIFTYGQFYENFDGNSKLPDGWISYKGDNRAGDDFDNWKIFNVEKTDDKCAFVRYENSGKLNEDWLDRRSKFY